MLSHVLVLIVSFLINADKSILTEFSTFPVSIVIIFERNIGMDILQNGHISQTESLFSDVTKHSQMSYRTGFHVSRNTIQIRSRKNLSNASHVL